MNPTDNTTTADPLEARLRRDLDGIAMSTPTGQPGRFDPDQQPFTLADQTPRRNASYLLAAAAVTALTVTGLVAISARSTPEPAASEPPASATLPSTPPTVVDPCSDEGCAGFDPLPIAAGSTDYYAGPIDLGEPVVATEWFDYLTRCIRLSTDSTTCEQIEGIAGVPLVAYPANADTPATSDPETGFDANQDTTIVIGTTFTDVDPIDYADLWGPTQGDGPQQPATVRGHDAIRYLNETTPAVVWQERPGVLVWVGVPSDREDELMDIAQNVRRVEGPDTIPYRVIIPEFSTGWDTEDNDGDGLVAARSQGVECVGLNFVDTCGMDIVDRTIIRPESVGFTTVAGSAPLDVTTIRISTAADVPVELRTTPFADSASNFYSAELSPEQGSVQKVAWLTADGEIVDTITVPTPPSPDTADGSVDTIEGTTATVCTVPGACGTYEILEGDSPALIAEKFCLTIDELRNANGGGNLDSFGLPGSSIQIPPYDGRSPCPDVGDLAEPFPFDTMVTTSVPPAN